MPCMSKRVGYICMCICIYIYTHIYIAIVVVIIIYLHREVCDFIWCVWVHGTNKYVNMFWFAIEVNLYREMAAPYGQLCVTLEDSFMMSSNLITWTGPYLIWISNADTCSRHQMMASFMSATDLLGDLIRIILYPDISFFLSKKWLRAQVGRVLPALQDLW